MKSKLSINLGVMLVLRRLQLFFGRLNTGSSSTASLQDPFTSFHAAKACFYLKAHRSSDAQVTSVLFSVPRPFSLLVF